MKNQRNRSMKVHAQSGYNYKATPTIILKGQWLQEMGFEIGDYISVSCEDGKLIITPDAEKAAMAKAEAEFMERRVLFMTIFLMHLARLPEEYRFLAGFIQIWQLIY